MDHEWVRRLAEVEKMDDVEAMEFCRSKGFDRTPGGLPPRYAARALVVLEMAEHVLRARRAA